MHLTAKFTNNEAPFDNIRIYFAPCGLGHIARCEVIFKRLSQMCRAEAYFATYNDSAHGPRPTEWAWRSA